MYNLVGPLNQKTLLTIWVKDTIITVVMKPFHSSTVITKIHVPD